MFHTTPTPTVCYSVPSLVQVSGGCQFGQYICLLQRGIAIVKLFASYAKSIDCANIHGFLHRLWIYRLRRQIDGLRRSTDCAQHLFMNKHYFLSFPNCLCISVHCWLKEICVRCSTPARPKSEMTSEEMSALNLYLCML